MLLRTLLIEIKSKYDNSGFVDASDDVEDLGEEASKTSKSLDKLDDELDEAARGAKKFSKGAKAAGREVKKTEGFMARLRMESAKLGPELRKQAFAKLAALGPALAAAGLALAIRGVGQAIAFVGEKTAELDKIAKDAAKRGFNTDDYQLLDQVATLSGTSIQSLGKGVTDLNVRLQEVARGGTGPAAKALDELGLSYATLQAQDPTEQLKTLSTAIGGIKDPAAQSRLAFELMGEQGRELIPLFNSGADAIDGMVNSIDKIFTREELAQAEAYQDSLANLTQVTEQLKGELVLGAVPALQAFAEFARDIIPPAVQLWRDAVGPLTPAFTRLGDALERTGVDVGPIVLRWIEFVVGPLRRAAERVAFFAEVWADVIEVGTDVIEWIQELLGLVETRFPRAFDIAARAVNAILHPLETARSTVASIFDFLEKSFSEIDGIASRVRSIRSTLGLSQGESVAAEAVETTPTANTGAGAAAVGVAQARTREARIRARIEAEQQANQAAALAAAQTPRRRGRGGGGRAAAAAAPEQNDLLGSLGLQDPGSVLEGRPAPQTLTIIFSVTIKMIESLAITVQGGSSPAQTAALRDAANQARDEILASMSDIPPLFAAMLRTQAKSLQASAGGGRKLQGAG
jgi:hypothetical protein